MPLVQIDQVLDKILRASEGDPRVVVVACAPAGASPSRLSPRKLCGGASDDLTPQIRTQPPQHAADERAPRQRGMWRGVQSGAERVSEQFES